MKRRGVVSPPVGKLNIIFVDDIHLGWKDEFGNRSNVDVIRSWLCNKGWIDRKTL